MTLSQEGRNVVEYRSIDRANNIEEIKSVAVWIDKTAPATKASTNGVAGEGHYNNADVTINFNAADGSGSGVAKTEYRLNNGEWMTVEGAVTLSQEGRNIVDYRSIDLANNLEEIKSVVVWIDKTAPATKASTNGAAEENQYNNEDVTIHFNAEDGSGSGVAKTEYRINSGQWMTVEGDVTLSREGKNAVDYRSTDFAGNVEESKRIEVWIDKTAPKITVEGSLSFYQTDSAIPVSIKIEDELSGFDKYELILDGTSISGLGEIKPVSLNPGEHTLTIRAEDGAGNSILKEVKLYSKIDIDHLDELITIGDDNNWITKEGTVKSLQSKVKAVQKAKKEKQLDKKLKDLFREIDSERGKTIQKEYADLLINDIEYILKNEI